MPGSACYTEFYIPEMNLNVVPLPEKAVLKGKNASFYQVEQVCGLKIQQPITTLLIFWCGRLDPYSFFLVDWIGSYF